MTCQRAGHRLWLFRADRITLSLEKKSFSLFPEITGCHQIDELDSDSGVDPGDNCTDVLSLVPGPWPETQDAVLNGGR
jgi:hypothetical protein